ncbi:lysine exporter LysO family protein [Phocoenobacter skyensis]|uniref:Lysine exporter LysO family protein n=1 Tax=Phocoenobacter skyensis TaxID=97481 RepID=A0A1H7Y9L5_9PAST|nr:lysine exporter LysO family protein [Pasteurella skyensis]MDP8078778.1 lysine exporter LysO family protein [Pasteurella skyensis]MDP8085896.1 lysine exporter LysO family protein [Pasteurella skyensis]MDP8185954.1 lysine exporter LysO family protein [Pasteurella skyensis]QLB22744.1 hypothetical protein A6B44_05780 [Pasteurella skyensis]SEM42916.1 Uncharacterized membrane protein YbjE, DUF340 family [Pasteurella skyensis]
MLYGLSIVFVPLLIGYFIKISQKRWLLLVNHLLNWCFYSILFSIGCSLGQLNNLNTVLADIGYTAFLMAVIVQICSIGCLFLFDILFPFHLEAQSNEPPPSRLKLLFESLLLCLTVLLGGFVGFFSKGIIAFSPHLSVYPLVVMILCVGIQLKNSGIPLKEVFANKRGLQLSLVFVLSGAMSGILIAIFCEFSFAKGLMFASGFGWFSLSSTLIGDALGTVAGSTAFFNDLFRDICCFFTIPFFMRRFPSTAVGLGGATSFDVNLPLIQKTGGMQVVPMAISFGFIINILVPLFLSFFIGLV